MRKDRAVAAVGRRLGRPGHMRVKPAFAILRPVASGAARYQIPIGKLRQPPIQKRLSQIHIQRMGHFLQKRAVACECSLVHPVLFWR